MIEGRLGGAFARFLAFFRLGRLMKRLAVPLAAVMLSAFVLAPAAASASTAEVNRSTLAIYYRAAPGEANRLSATTTGGFPRSGSVTFSDPGASITPGNGCTGSTAHVVICAFDFGASPALPRAPDADPAGANVHGPRQPPGSHT